MSPVTFNVVRHMSRMRSTPENQRNQRRVHPDGGEHDDDERNGAGPHSSRTDAAQDRKIRDHDLLAQTQMNSGELREKQHGDTFV